jgi:hypothetical protein
VCGRDELRMKGEGKKEMKGGELGKDCKLKKRQISWGQYLLRK